MEVIVNRTPVAARDGATLSELLAALGTPADGVAVAVNNRVVPRSEWASATPVHYTHLRSHVTDSYLV